MGWMKEGEVVLIWVSSILVGTENVRSVRLAACPQIKQFPLHIHLPEGNDLHSGRRFHHLVVHSEMSKVD